jgi:hypothetical protein
VRLRVVCAVGQMTKPAGIFYFPVGSKHYPMPLSMAVTTFSKETVSG